MSRLTIKQKITTSILCATLIIFGTFLSYLYFEVKPKNEEDVSFLIQQNIETKASDISQWIEKRVIEYRTLAMMPAIKSMDVRRITPIIDEINSSYNTAKNGMEAFSFIGNNGFCWINSEATEKLIRYEEYTKAYESPHEFIIGSPLINEDNREVILFYYPIKGYTNQKESLITAAIPLARIKELVNTLQLYNGKTWIMTRNHNILTTSSNYLYQNILDESVLNNIDFSDITTSTIFEVPSIKGKAKLFVSVIPSYQDWIVCSLVTETSIHSSIDALIQGCIILLGFLLILTIILTHYVGISVLKPIKILQKKMQQVEINDLDSYYPLTSSNDEIQALGKSYNKMLDDINLLIDRVYYERKEKEQAEYEMLQTQIKPHFLYNALDNIKWMAKKHEADDVSKAITDLSTFFRISLSKGANNISLKEEFKFTKSYMDIQKMRFEGQFNYIINLHEQAENILVPKMFIQPFVENTIIHGFKDNDRQYTLSIEAYLDSSDLIVLIEDDGNGMTQETIISINSYLNKSFNNQKHFGMLNSFLRLEHSFKSRVSVDIKSTILLGTTITITIKEVLACIAR